MALANRLGNPFICGGPVPLSHFIGREREVQIVFDQITSQALGNIAICGDRRIGKTSLLQYIYHWVITTDDDNEPITRDFQPCGRS